MAVIGFCLRLTLSALEMFIIVLCSQFACRLIQNKGSLSIFVNVLTFC